MGAVMVTARLHHTVLDCPDPAATAQFWSALLEMPISYSSADFVVVSDNEHASGLAFQRAENHQPPKWPDPSRPQQIHFDVMVADVAAGSARVRELGGTSLSGSVFADPAGHPFCLILRPTWAPPLDGEAPEDGGPTGDAQHDRTDQEHSIQKPGSLPR
ncbi:MAG: VOC family protein [bacterium]